MSLEQQIDELAELMGKHVITMDKISRFPRRGLVPGQARMLITLHEELFTRGKAMIALAAELLKNEQLKSADRSICEDIQTNTLVDHPELMAMLHKVAGKLQ